MRGLPVLVGKPRWTARFSPASGFCFTSRTSGASQSSRPPSRPESHGTLRSTSPRHGAQNPDVQYHSDRASCPVHATWWLRFSPLVGNVIAFLKRNGQDGAIRRRSTVCEMSSRKGRHDENLTELFSWSSQCLVVTQEPNLQNHLRSQVEIRLNSRKLRHLRTNLLRSHLLRKQPMRKPPLRRHLMRQRSRNT